MGTQFEEVAYDPAKNVLVLLYTPWRWETEELLERYTKLAETFKEEEDVVIAKMNVVENEVEDIAVHKLPTLLFFKAGGNGREKVELEGERSLDAMKAFVEKNRVAVVREEEEL